MDPRHFGHFVGCAPTRGFDEGVAKGSLLNLPDVGFLSFSFVCCALSIDRPFKVFRVAPHQSAGASGGSGLSIAPSQALRKKLSFAVQKAALLSTSRSPDSNTVHHENEEKKQRSHRDIPRADIYLAAYGQWIKWS